MIQPNPTCYMCSAPKASIEHVPPRGLFPETKDLPTGVNLRMETNKAEQAARSLDTASKRMKTAVRQYKI